MNTTAYNFITVLMQTIQTLINNFIIAGYNAVMTYISPALSSIIALFIIGIGVGIWTDHIQISHKNFFTMIFKIVIVWTLASNWGFVSMYVVSFIQTTANDIGVALVEAMPVQIPGGGSAPAALQVVADEFYNYGHTLLSQGGITSASSFSSLIEGLLIWIAGIIFVSFALFELILAQIGMALLFVITPFVALFLLTPWTKNVFQHWMGQLIGYMFLIILIYAVIALCCDICYQMLPTHNFSNIENLTAQGFLPPLITIFVSTFVLFRVQSIAMHLGSGVGISSGAGVAGAAVSGFLGGMVSNVHDSSVGALRGLSSSFSSDGMDMGQHYKNAEQDAADLRRGD